MALTDLFADIADAINDRAGHTIIDSEVSEAAPDKAKSLAVRLNALPMRSSKETSVQYEGAEGLRNLFAAIATNIRKLTGSTDDIAANDFPNKIRSMKKVVLVFTESTTWTVPDGVSRVYVIVVGGGGGGGGQGGYGGKSGSTFDGGYGGAGLPGILKRTSELVEPREAIRITIGSQGEGGTHGSVSYRPSTDGVRYSGGKGGSGSNGYDSSFRNTHASGGSGNTGGLGAGIRATADVEPTTPYPAAPGHHIVVESEDSTTPNIDIWAGGGGASGENGQKGVVIVQYYVPAGH